MSVMPRLHPSCRRSLPALLALSVAFGSIVAQSFVLSTPSHAAEKYQSRLNTLLLRKNDLYLPTRLVIGEPAKFIVKAAPGSRIKLYISTRGEGFTPKGNVTSLRVGPDAQEIAGTVPSTGVLSLQMDMPKDETLEGKFLYVDAMSGPSDDSLNQMDLVDASGRRTNDNALAIVKPSQMGGPNLTPNLPGVSPQLFNQLTQMGSLEKDDPRRKMLDTGEINNDREIDKNPFVNRGVQPGIQY